MTNEVSNFNRMKRLSIFCVLFFCIELDASINHKSIDLISIYNSRFEHREKTIERLTAELSKHPDNDDSKLLIHSLLALTYNYLKKYDAAKQEISHAEKRHNGSLNSIGEAFYNYALAKYYGNYDINDMSFEHYLRAFNIFKILKIYNLASEMAVNIAYVSSNESLNYRKLALILSENESDLSSKINARCCYSNFIKDELNTNEKTKYTSDTLLDYLKNTVALVKNENEINNKFYLSTLYFNYGYNLLLYKGDTNGNLYLEKALGLAKKYYFLSVFRNYYGAKASIYKSKALYSEAKQLYKESLNYINKIPFIENSYTVIVYKDLKEIAATEQNWKEYYEWDKEYQKINEILNDETTKKNIASAVAKYELKEKEEKIHILTQKNQLKIYLIIAIITALCIASVAFYFYKKSNQVKIQLLHEQKNKVSNERNQAQKELLSSILHLEKKNEILNDVKQELIDQNQSNSTSIQQKIVKIIEEGLLLDDDFEKFKENFNPIYPDFFNKLQHKAQNNLTPLDLKYCGFILMKLTNKEIALQMNVEPKSIRMARYRIKQKLQLSKEEDLDTFIQSLV